jgi:CHAD domain-containing protein
VPPRPRALGGPALPAEASVETGLRWVIGHLTDVVLHWAEAVQAGERWEPVHQMRVALRRLRAALSVFRPILDEPALKPVQESLRHLNALLGPARDWDVFISGTAAAVAQAFPDGASITRLLAAAERQQRACYGQLLGFLASSEFRQLTIRLSAMAADGEWLHPADDSERVAILTQNLMAYGGPALDKKLKKVVRDVDIIEEMPAADLHRLRLNAKRLRYAAEFFAHLYRAREPRRFLRRLTRLQDQLGHLNDVNTVSTLLARLPGRTAEHRFAVGVITGFAAATSGGARQEVATTWRKFRRQPPFWR